MTGALFAAVTPFNAFNNGIPTIGNEPTNSLICNVTSDNGNGDSGSLSPETLIQPLQDAGDVKALVELTMGEDETVMEVAYGALEELASAGSTEAQAFVDEWSHDGSQLKKLVEGEPYNLPHSMRVRKSPAPAPSPLQIVFQFLGKLRDEKRVIDLRLFSIRSTNADVAARADEYLDEILQPDRATDPIGRPALTKKDLEKE